MLDEMYTEAPLILMGVHSSHSAPSFPSEATCFHKTIIMHHIVTLRSVTGHKYNDGLTR